MMMMTMMNIKELWLSLVASLEHTCTQYPVKRQNNEKVIVEQGRVLISRLNAALLDHVCLCNC